MSEGKKYDIKYYSKPKDPADRESLEKTGYKMLNDEEAKKVIDALVRMYPGDESIQSLY